MAAAAYDIFLSHAWKDGERPQHIADALTEAGLRVWFDATEIEGAAGLLLQNLFLAPRLGEIVIDARYSPSYDIHVDAALSRYATFPR
jgi:hypothetical protein